MKAYGAKLGADFWCCSICKGMSDKRSRARAKREGLWDTEASMESEDPWRKADLKPCSEYPHCCQCGPYPDWRLCECAMCEDANEQ